MYLSSRRRFRILMVVESAGGGTGRHVLDLSEGLLNRDCEVHLIYSTGRLDQLFLDRLQQLPSLPHLAVPMHTAIHPSDLAVVRTVRRYLHDHGPFDAIHGHSSKGGAIARLAALGTSTAAFYTLHGLIMMDPGLAPWKRNLYLGIEQALSLRTSRIIAVSPEETRAAVRLRLGHSRVTLIPNGVGPLALTPRPEARRSLGVPDDAVVFGFVGRLVEQKAPQVLIEAFARMVSAVASGQLPVASKPSPGNWQPKTGNLFLALVGSGPLDAPLRSLSRRLGIADRILFLGERDARTVLAAFDVFAIASRKEGLPYVVLEAMAAGLPVVATASAGVGILVQSGENGQVVPRDDISAFADAMARLAADPAHRNACGQASRRRASQFTIDAMVNRTLAAYTDHDRLNGNRNGGSAVEWIGATR